MRSSYTITSYRGAVQKWTSSYVGLGLLLLTATGCQLTENLSGREPVAVIEDYETPAAGGYLDQGPVIRGQVLNQPDRAPTATERALELFDEVEGLRAETHHQQAEIESLHAELAASRASLEHAEEALKQADTDLQRAQSTVETWRGDVEMLHRKMKLREEAQLKALDDVIRLLHDDTGVAGSGPPSNIDASIQSLEQAYSPMDELFTQPRSVR